MATFKEMDIVALKDGENVVGKGRVMSLDKERLCHNIPLGEANVLVEIINAYSSSYICPNGDTLEECIGAPIVWEVKHVQPITEFIESTEKSFAESNNLILNLSPISRPTDSTAFGSSTESDRDTCARRPPLLSSIPMDDWFGEDVQVMNEKGYFVGTASIQVLNESDYVQGYVLGKGNVGVFFKTVNQILGPPEITWLHSIRAWDSSKLISHDGKSLKEHIEQKEKENAGRTSGRLSRTYTFVTRKRKIHKENTSKKKRVLSDESIRQVSTKDCCKERCCQFFDRNILRLVREKHWAKSFAEKKEEMYLAVFNAHISSQGERITVLHSIPVCLEAWRIIHGYGKTCFNYAKHCSRGGNFAIATQHGNRGLKRKETEKVLHMETFVRATCHEMADFHPSKIRSVDDGTKQSRRVLPSSFNWNQMRVDGNESAKDLGIPPMSQASFSRLRKTFSDVSIKAKGDNFSRCSICCELAQRKDKRSLSSIEIEKLRQESEQHHQEHREGRRLYAAWRDESKRHPEDSLCIIHDKMDHFKTSLPSWQFTPKSLDGTAKLPVTVTGILTHGHGPRAIAQYNIALWPADSNATVGSIDSILRMIENPKPMINTICNGPDSTKLFTQVLAGGRSNRLQEAMVAAFEKFEREDMEKKGETIQGEVKLGRPLPRILRLQLDNCAGDNKNRIVMAYLSMLTSKGIFEEVHLGFLMVGHTHEDVDAMFGNFSDVLKRGPALSLLQLMKTFMMCRNPNPIPHFTQEVPDFKSFLEPYLLSGKDALVGHLKPRLFRFYIRDSDKMPCMQYKMKSSSEEWIPTGGIEMWGKNDDGSPNIPTGDPKRLPMIEMKGIELVELGLLKNSEFMSNLGVKMGDEKQKKYYLDLAQYWKKIASMLKGAQYEDTNDANHEKLQYGFWPSSRWNANRSLETATHDKIPLDDMEHYVGPKSLQPKIPFNPRLDIDMGSFVLVRPHEDKSIYPVFLGKVISEINSIQDDEGSTDYRCQVQWFRPFDRKSRISYEARYKDCWQKDWEVSIGEEVQEISIGSIVWSFKMTPKKTGRIKIRVSDANAAKDNLRRCEEAEEAINVS